MFNFNFKLNKGFYLFIFLLALFNIMTEETVKWLDEQKARIEENNKEGLLDLLENTTDVIRQLLNNPKSRTCIGLAESCMEHNKLLIDDLSN